MKGFKGGYKIVSLQLNDITSDFTLSGIYNDIKESHDKPILVSEIVVNGEKMNDAYTIVKKDDTDFIIEVYGYALTVASDDSVTVALLPEITSIGTGLDLTDGELSASGGDKLYLHFFYVSAHSDSTAIYFQCISKSETDTFKDIMENIRLNSTGDGVFTNGLLVATGYSRYGNQCNVYTIYPNSETNFVMKGTKADYYTETKAINYADIQVYTHKVIEL